MWKFGYFLLVTFYVKSIPACWEANLLSLISTFPSSEAPTKLSLIYTPKKFDFDVSGISYQFLSATILQLVKVTKFPLQILHILQPLLIKVLIWYILWPPYSGVPPKRRKQSLSLEAFLNWSRSTSLQSHEMSLVQIKALNYDEPVRASSHLAELLHIGFYQAWHCNYLY